MNSTTSLARRADFQPSLALGRPEQPRHRRGRAPVEPSFSERAALAAALALLARALTQRSVKQMSRRASAAPPQRDGSIPPALDVGEVAIAASRG